MDQQLPSQDTRFHDTKRAVLERAQGNLIDETGPLHAAFNFTTYLSFTDHFCWTNVPLCAKLALRLRKCRLCPNNHVKGLIVRFHVTIDTERCKGCELCVEVCPRQLIAMSSSVNSAGSHFAEMTSINDCSGCINCAHICPDAAIEIEKYDEHQEKTEGLPHSHDGK